MSQEEGEEEITSREGGDGAFDEERAEVGDRQRKPLSARPRNPSLTPMYAILLSSWEATCSIPGSNHTAHVH